MNRKVRLRINKPSAFFFTFPSNRQENRLDPKEPQTLCNLRNSYSDSEISLWHGTILNPMHHEKRSLRLSRATIFDSFSSSFSFLWLWGCGLPISTLKKQDDFAAKENTNGSALHFAHRVGGGPQGGNTGTYVAWHVRNHKIHTPIAGHLYSAWDTEG